MTPKPAESPFQTGHSVDDIRAAFLALPESVRLKVYDPHRFRPRNPVFFHPTQQQEEACPFSSLFFLRPELWNTHMKNEHKQFFDEHAKQDKRGNFSLYHHHSKHCLGQTAEGLACRGTYAGSTDRPVISAEQQFVIGRPFGPKWVLLDLCSGSNYVNKFVKQNLRESWCTVSLDISTVLGVPDIQADLTTWDYTSIDQGSVDCIVFFPECRNFSNLLYSTPHIKRDFELANGLVQAGLRVIAWHMQKNPKLIFIMENPMKGLLKDQFCAKALAESCNVYNISYCMYGRKFMKPTTLWSNLEGFSPRLCSKANLCQFADKSGRHLEGTGRGGTKASKPVHDTLNELPYALLADLFEGVQAQLESALRPLQIHPAALSSYGQYYDNSWQQLNIAVKKNSNAEIRRIITNTNSSIASEGRKAAMHQDKQLYDSRGSVKRHKCTNGG